MIPMTEIEKLKDGVYEKVIYRLDHPIPAKYITKTDSSGVL